MVTVMSVSKISVLLWKNGESAVLIEELVKQECGFLRPCSNDMHA